MDIEMYNITPLTLKLAKQYTIFGVRMTDNNMFKSHGIGAIQMSSTDVEKVLANHPV